MASFHFNVKGNVESEADGDDWMDGLIAADSQAGQSTGPGPVKPQQNVGLGPQVQPVAVTWMQPSPSTAGLKAAPKLKPKATGPTPSEKQVQRSEWNKSAALATAAAHKAASASEAAVRLANLAVKQMAETKASRITGPVATPVKQRGQKRSATEAAAAGDTLTPSPLLNSKRVPLQDGNHTQVAEGAENSGKGSDEFEDPPASPEDTLPIAESTDTESKKYGGSGCFAGHRPPKNEEALEVFEYKKRMFHETRAELEKKYPGKLINLGRTASQQSWWSHLRTHFALAKKGPGKKQKLMTKETTLATIDAAAKTWRTRLDEMAEKA
jgi:hypothetical protein